MCCIACSSLPVSLFERTSMRVLKSPSAMRCATSIACRSGAEIERASHSASSTPKPIAAPSRAKVVKRAIVYTWSAPRAACWLPDILLDSILSSWPLAASSAGCDEPLSTATASSFLPSLAKVIILPCSAR